MAALPSPSGPHAVGTASHALTDGDRPSHLLSDVSGRELFIKLWYPADCKDGEPERLWAQFRDIPNLPLPLRGLLWWFRNNETNSVNGTPFAGIERPRLVIYNHGLISFASENTSLAEDLASHGFIVIAIEHRAQLAEFQALNRAQAKEKRRQDAARQKALLKAAPAERADMARAYYEDAENTNRIVAGRASDTAFVLRHLKEVLASVPGLDPDTISKEVSLVGLSLGGAVATECAKSDQRTTSIVNLDGGLYGSRIGAPIPQPYLMMYSSASEGINDTLLPEAARRVTPPGSKHLNYHDISALMPVLRLTGATGKTDAAAFIEYRNQQVREFLLA